MLRKVLIFIWLAYILTVCFWICLSAIFTDSVAETELRNQLCGSWQLVSYPKDTKYHFLVKEGEIIRFSKYFFDTKDTFLPKQYKIKTISYKKGGHLFYNRQEIFFSAKGVRSDYGYVISGISSDSLILFPSFMINFRVKEGNFLFKKVTRN